jgi:pimeloyl-ACP methyl ester carboxylesterase
VNVEPGKRRRWSGSKRIARIVAVTAAVVYLGLLGLLIAEHGRMVFPGAGKVSAETPAENGLAFEDVRIPVDGKSFTEVWWVPATRGGTRTVIYFHGNYEVLGDEVDREVGVFHASGVNLLAVEYRGFGGSSSGQPTAATTAADALAALQYPEQKRGIAARDVVIVGYSIGTGVAAQLAVDAPDAGGLILIGAITSTSDVGNSTGAVPYILRPAEWLVHDDDFATKDKIAQVHMPLLMITGTKDETAQPWMAREIFARANEPKRLVWIEGADHNDVMDTRDGTYAHTIESFLAGLGAA